MTTSLTAQMISMNQATAALIAKKLTETEGVAYEVVKETKGYRVVKAGKPQTASSPMQFAIDNGIETVKAAMKPALKTPEDAPLVSASTAPAQMLPFGEEFHVTCELRSETPTMIKAAINGEPRAFDKKYLLGWDVDNVAKTVTMKMNSAQAKKWKLVK